MNESIPIKKTYNVDNLNDNEIDEVVIRVKAILLNRNDEIILCHCNNTYQFPGGHLFKDESLSEGLKREVMEEIGISISNIKEPFYITEYYNKNYHNTSKNRKSIVYFYQILCDEDQNYQQTSLEQDEIAGHFKSVRVKLSEVSSLLDNTINDNKINKIIYQEIKEAISMLPINKK